MHLYEAETCGKNQIPGGQVLNVIVVSNLRIRLCVLSIYSRRINEHLCLCAFLTFKTLIDNTQKRLKIMTQVNYIRN